MISKVDRRAKQGNSVVFCMNFAMQGDFECVSNVRCITPPFLFTEKDDMIA